MHTHTYVVYDPVVVSLSLSISHPLSLSLARSLARTLSSSSHTETHTPHTLTWSMLETRLVSGAAIRARAVNTYKTKKKNAKQREDACAQVLPKRYVLALYALARFGQLT